MDSRLYLYLLSYAYFIARISQEVYGIDGRVDMGWFQLRQFRPGGLLPLLVEPEGVLGQQGDHQRFQTGE